MSTKPIANFDVLLFCFNNKICYYFAVLTYSGIVKLRCCYSFLDSVGRLGWRSGPEFLLLPNNFGVDLEAHSNARVRVQLEFDVGFNVGNR